MLKKLPVLESVSTILKKKIINEHVNVNKEIIALFKTLKDKNDADFELALEILGKAYGIKDDTLDEWLNDGATLSSLLGDALKHTNKDDHQIRKAFDKIMKNREAGKSKKMVGFSKDELEKIKLDRLLDAMKDDKNGKIKEFLDKHAKGKSPEQALKSLGSEKVKQLEKIINNINRGITEAAPANPVSREKALKVLTDNGCTPDKFTKKDGQTFVAYIGIEKIKTADGWRAEVEKALEASSASWQWIDCGKSDSGKFWFAEFELVPTVDEAGIGAKLDWRERLKDEGFEFKYKLTSKAGKEEDELFKHSDGRKARYRNDSKELEMFDKKGNSLSTEKVNEMTTNESSKTDQDSMDCAIDIKDSLGEKVKRTEIIEYIKDNWPQYAGKLKFLRDVISNLKYREVEIVNEAVNEGLYTRETADPIIKELQAGIKAPWCSVFSGLGSIIIQLSLQKKEDWENGIRLNSPWASMILEPSGEVYQSHSFKGKPFRKFVAKDAKTVIDKINQYVEKAAASTTNESNMFGETPTTWEVGQTYTWTGGAELFNVKYIGRAEKHPDIKPGSSYGKGHLFELPDGKYFELSTAIMRKHLINKLDDVDESAATELGLEEMVSFDNSEPEYEVFIDADDFGKKSAIKLAQKMGFDGSPDTGFIVMTKVALKKFVNSLKGFEIGIKSIVDGKHNEIDPATIEEYKQRGRPTNKYNYPNRMREAAGDSELQLHEGDEVIVNDGVVHEGEKGIVAEEPNGSFVVVEIKGQNYSFHSSDVTLVDEDEEDEDYEDTDEDEYNFVVDLDERGDFEAHIEDNTDGNVVFEMDTADLLDFIEDGFMKNKNDVDGLVKHLIEIGTLPEGAFVNESVNEAKKDKTPKEFTIVKTHRGREKEVTGTLEYLIEYFGYTLKAGNSWNSKIPLKPKNAKALIKALTDSVAETQGGSYDRDSYSLKAKPSEPPVVKVPELSEGMRVLPDELYSKILEKYPNLSDVLKRNLRKVVDAGGKEMPGAIAAILGVKEPSVMKIMRTIDNYKEMLK